MPLVPVAPAWRAPPSFPDGRPSSARHRRIARKAALDMGDGKGASQQHIAMKRSAPAYGFGSATREQMSRFSGEGLVESPGPAQYVLPASVGGKQPDGRKRDPPVWAFNVADRFLYGYGNSDDKPGPTKYNLKSCIGGKQPDGRVRDAPVFSFGNATRDQANKLFVSQEHTLLATGGSDSPGPAQYSLKASIGGKQPDGRKPDPPVFSFSTAARAPVEAGLESPGPIYAQPATTMQPQPDGKYRNAPRFLFAQSTRSVRAKVFLGTEYQATEAPAMPTPGPAGPYKLTPAIGTQVSSKRSTSPRMAFSRASRWATLEREMERNTVPGPGAYG